MRDDHQTEYNSAFWDGVWLGVILSITIGGLLPVFVYSFVKILEHHFVLKGII